MVSREQQRMVKSISRELSAARRTQERYPDYRPGRVSQEIKVERQKRRKGPRLNDEDDGSGDGGSCLHSAHSTNDMPSAHPTHQSGTTLDRNQVRRTGQRRL